MPLEPVGAFFIARKITEKQQKIVVLEDPLKITSLLEVIIKNIQPLLISLEGTSTRL
jgi:hypothetical protein